MNKMTTNSIGYYTPSAFDSIRLRPLIPMDDSKLGYCVRTFRRDMLANHGSAQCREFLALPDQISVIEYLSASSKEMQEALNDPVHEKMTWQTLRNPQAIVDTIVRLMLIFSVIAWACLLIFSLISLFDKPSWFLSAGFLKFLVFPTIFTIIHLLGKMILKTNIVKDKNNIQFNRRKGIVSIPRKKQKPLELPFDEFDGYVGSTVNPSGSRDYHLIVAHRHSAAFVQHPGGCDAPWRVAVKWEYLQQYMDISKPLPDIPSMEPYRYRDPVTAEYDHKHDRPKNYWENMGLEKAGLFNDASSKAAQQYPWGLTRDQALQAGWKPSGCGEGDWRSSSEVDEHSRVVGTGVFSIE